ncbi:ABC transporter permease [Rhizobium sp. PL01]|uniref:ABC transporter permease n=1 Tax=Rhizobium sp. PL01 TaxID=3085631 RepID=UPI002981F0C9|nr:ABC transporter permease subunit [Rhizobium sp. PL01]MDW5317577.1 ABC transporter permease subunit [Rhizobium sp. PL01]
MSDTSFQLTTIAKKEIRDAARGKLFTLVSLLLILCGATALIVGAVAMNAEVANYAASRDLLLSLGKSADALAPPAFKPLALLRSFIEYLEIIGAILGIVLGHRTAASERGRNTLGLLLTRPLSFRVLLAGKTLGSLAVLVAILAAVFCVGAAGITLIGGVGLTAPDIARILVTFAAAAIYVGSFFLLGLLLALHMRRPAHAIMAAFAIWLVLVLIVPQIGDTLDPDNQVGAGVFRTLGIAKPQEKQIMTSFATYETVRDGIEQLSPAKHLERWSFAALGIKEIYYGQPLVTVMRDRWSDAAWLVGQFIALLTGLFMLSLQHR